MKIKLELIEDADGYEELAVCVYDKKGIPKYRRLGNLASEFLKEIKKTEKEDELNYPHADTPRDRAIMSFMFCMEKYVRKGQRIWVEK